MRVLLVTNDYLPKPGGIQQYLGNLVDRYEGPVRVLAPAEPGASTDERVRRAPQRFMWPTHRTRTWVEEHIAEFSPSVVVFGAPHPLAQLGPGLQQRTGVPYAVVVHGAEAIIPLAVPGVGSLVRSPLRQAGTVFAVSDFTRERVASAAGRPVRLLGMGVDLESFSPAPRPPVGFVVGCVSRFVPRKGHLKVIEAIAELRSRGHEVTGLIVGRGRLEGRLRRRVASLGVPVRFEIDVTWTRLPELYREMSVFAMPARSRWFGLEFEGLGIVYLEAGASGLPVLAGASGGSPETVRPGVTGFVVESTGDLVDALERLVKDPELRRTMGEGSRRFVEERYTWEAVLDRFERGLEEAVAPKSL